VKEKEILAQKEAFDKKLEAIRADIKQEKRQADRVRAEAERQDELTGSQCLRIAEAERGQSARFDLEHGHVGLMVYRHDLRADYSAAPAQD